MLTIIISVIGILVTIFFVIGTHEFAHFAVAKMLGVKVLRFSIGLGKTLFSRTDKSGTEYVFALIPLGGYVKMLDELEGEVPKDQLHLAFNRQPYYKKFLIVIAGPLMNLFCAALLYWLIFVIGFVTIKPIVGTVTPQSIAALAGVKPNSEIIAVQQYETLTWAHVILRLLQHAGDNDTVNMTTKALTSPNPVTTHTLDLNHWSLEGLNPDPLKSLGITPFEPHLPLTVDSISKDSPASQSPLKLGDLILAVDGKPVPDWETLMKTIVDHPDQTLQFTVKRDKETLTLPVKLGHHPHLFTARTGYLGIGPIYQPPPELLRTIKYSPIEAIPRAVQEIWNFTYFNVMIFGKMITGKISLETLGGPITIFETAGKSLNYGFIAFLGFLAFLSVALGIINLLPIPGLDGGHILINTIELIMRKPMPVSVIVLLYRLGFLAIVLLVFQAIVNDVSRLF